MITYEQYKKELDDARKNERVYNFTKEQIRHAIFNYADLSLELRRVLISMINQRRFYGELQLYLDMDQQTIDKILVSIVDFVRLHGFNCGYSVRGEYDFSILISDKETCNTYPYSKDISSVLTKEAYVKDLDFHTLLRQIKE